MLKLSLEKCVRQNARRKDTRATVSTKTLRPAVRKIDNSTYDVVALRVASITIL